MNENLIANANLRVLNLNCRRAEMIRKNNPRINNTKGEQVYKSGYVTFTNYGIRREVTDSCYMSRIFYYCKVPLSVEIVQN